MKRILVRYKTKPERTKENEDLVAGVFHELRERAPAGVRYACMKLADGTFVHLAEIATADGSNPIPELGAFKAFQANIKDRCVEPPQSGDVTVVGDYRLLER